MLSHGEINLDASKKSIEKIAKEFGMSASSFKRMCRRNGLVQWSYDQFLFDMHLYPSTFSSSCANAAVLNLDMVFMEQTTPSSSCQSTLSPDPVARKRSNIDSDAPGATLNARSTRLLRGSKTALAFEFDD